jgi:hypothetical protein
MQYGPTLIGTIWEVTRCYDFTRYVNMEKEIPSSVVCRVMLDRGQLERKNQQK